MLRFLIRRRRSPDAGKALYGKCPNVPALVPLLALFFTLAAGAGESDLSPWSCRAPLRRIPWHNPTRITTPVFILHADPRLSSSDIRESRRRLERAHAELRRVYFFSAAFQPREDRRIHVVLFYDRKSYRNFLKNWTDLRANAHYSAASSTIYAPAQATRKTWRHELTHAFLNQGKRRAPYWLQEGAAYFIQQNAPAAKVRCAGKQPARAAPELFALLPASRIAADALVRNNPSLDGGGTIGALGHPALAAFFVFYLWDRGRLLQVIQQSISEEPELTLTEGDPLARRRLWIDFRSWLRSGRPLEARPGC